MTFSWNSVTDVMIIAYIGVSRWLNAQVQSTGSTPAGELSTYAGLVVTILAGVWVASRMWEQFRARGIQNREAIAAEKADIKELQAFRNSVEKDLLLRRSEIDKKLLLLERDSEYYTKRLDLAETRHNRLREKFERLVGSLSPILKDMDIDLRRLDLVGQLLSEEPEDPSGIE